MTQPECVGSLATAWLGLHQGACSLGVQTGPQTVESHWQACLQLAPAREYGMPLSCQGPEPNLAGSNSLTAKLVGQLSHVLALRMLGA